MVSGEQGTAGASLAWRDGAVPVSLRFDDPYFSLSGGLAETRHVFLAGNGLPGRLCEGFRIAELGFGTGLNLLATSLVWNGPGLVRFTSFEAFPMSADDMARALSAFPEVAEPASLLIGQWRAGHRRILLPGIEVEIVEGDANQTLPLWAGAADAWFLDGFSPAKNPELWSPGLMREVARHTAPGGTLASYTAAGHVRRSLAEAGFTVERRAGFGRKRHMISGTLG